MESDGQFVETCRLISQNWNWGTTYSNQLNPVHTPTNGIASHVAIMKIEEKYALAKNRIKDAVTERMVNHALAPSDWMVIIPVENDNRSRNGLRLGTFVFHTWSFLTYLNY